MPMTYKEAANRIEWYMKAQHNDDAHETRITKALQIAISLLRERAALEDCVAVIKKRSPIWYVDFEEGEIEEGIVHSVCYKDGRIDSFSVDFVESGDFDEFVGEAIGNNFFASKEMAEQALIIGHGIRN